MIYLHIGTHKTGSTVLQQTLDMYGEYLEKHSLAYYRYMEFLGPLLLYHSPLPTEDIKTLREGFEKYHGGQDMIISSEGFFGNPYLGYGNIAAVAHDLRTILRGEDVQVCAFIRNQDTFLESLYAQAVKECNQVEINKFLRDVDYRKFDWLKLLKIYENEFEVIKAFPYGPGCDVVNTVLQWINPDMKIEIPAPVIANTSYNKIGIQLALQLNPKLNDDQRITFRSFLERCFSKKPGEDFEILTGRKRQEICRHFAKSNLEAMRCYQ